MILECSTMVLYCSILLPRTVSSYFCTVPQMSGSPVLQKLWSRPETRMRKALGLRGLGLRALGFRVERFTV